MNPNNKYIIFREDASLYILQKNFPYYIGKLTNNPKEGISQYPITGYRLYVSFAGTLIGKYINSDKFSIQESFPILSDMGNFVLEMHILKHQEDYERYKVRSSN
jgi:hypothetical protein